MTTGTILGHHGSHRAGGHSLTGSGVFFRWEGHGDIGGGKERDNMSQKDQVADAKSYTRNTSPPVRMKSYMGGQRH